MHFFWIILLYLFTIQLFFHSHPQQVALDAAEKGDQHALYIKLSNNMGAVLRKQEMHAEVRLVAGSCTLHACALHACSCVLIACVHVNGPKGESVAACLFPTCRRPPYIHALL